MTDADRVSDMRERMDDLREVLNDRIDRLTEALAIAAAREATLREALGVAYGTLQHHGCASDECDRCAKCIVRAAIAEHARLGVEAAP